MSNDNTVKKAIKICGSLLVFYGAYNLLGVGGYKQFSMLFKGLYAPFISMLYVFSIMHGVCCIYCGMKISKFEEWARKTIIILTGISLVLGILLSNIVIVNLKDFMFSGTAGIPEMYLIPVYRMTVILTALAVVFEIFLVVFFTRSKVVEQFR